MGFLDPTYLCFMAPAFILMMLAQLYVTSSYNKWSRVAARSRLTGAQAAQRLISSGGLYNVSIQPIQGNLTDHYDPRSKVLSLSPGVYQGNSVAALAIAAHELGHAKQDQEGYLPLKLRAALVPAVNIGSYLGWILIIAGVLLKITGISLAGRAGIFRRAGIRPGNPAGGAKRLGARQAAADQLRLDRRHG